MEVPQLPPGIPPADPHAPKRELTQEQIDALRDGVFALFPALKAYWPLIMAVIAVVGGLGWFGGKTANGPNTEIVSKLDAILTKLDGRPPDVRPATPDGKRVTYMLTTATDVSILKNLPAGAVETYAVGSAYNSKGSITPLPVMVTRDAQGNDIEVRKLP